MSTLAGSPQTTGKSLQLSDDERAAAIALQHSLLPARLPSVLGVEFSARYVPGEHRGVGGDWYDVFTLPSGWLCVVIGDVVGHGLPAAVVMGRLRSALRAYSLEHVDPAQVLSKLNRKVQHFEPEMMATVLFAMFEPSLDRMHLSVAGHPAPVVAAPDQPTRWVQVPVDPPVGVRTGVPRKTTTIEVSPGTTLCFYTDGLVERRRASLDDGLSRLRESVVAGPAETVCADVMQSLVGGQPAGDDIAVLVVRRRELAEIRMLDLVLPAVPSSLHEIRIAMRRWLSVVGAGSDDVADLLVAVGEACANVIEHAYGPRGGDIALHVALDAGDVLATVSDTGQQRPPRGWGRGRGLVLMQECSDQVHVAHHAGGTQVVIRRRPRNVNP